jgi:hypothetical protein
VDQEGVAHLESLQPDRVGPAKWLLGGESSSGFGQMSSCMHSLQGDLAVQWQARQLLPS